MEIEELDAGIRMMAGKIEELFANVRKEEEMKHLIQLQLLQAQVNPHFLYNTLDTIIWLIEGGQTEDDAVEMISSLSVFFRTSLSKGEGHYPAFRGKTPYPQLSGDPAVKIPGYPGIRDPYSGRIR